MTRLTNTRRDAILKDIAVELKRVRALPAGQLPEDTQRRLITARNMLRAIKTPLPPEGKPK